MSYDIYLKDPVAYEMIELEDRSGSDGPKRYKLTGKLYLSETSGTLGDHKELKIYERLDCLSAHLYIAKGQEESQESPDLRTFVCFLMCQLPLRSDTCQDCYADSILQWRGHRHHQ